MHYYIEYESGRQGPMDLLGIIRKIRNGSLSKHDLIIDESSEVPQPKPAYQHEMFYEVFIEQDRMEQEQEDADQLSQISLMELLKTGFSMLKEDQTAMMISGLFLLASLLTVSAAALALPPIAAAIGAPIVVFILLHLCLVAMLRVARIQLLSMSFFGQVLRKHSGAMFGALLLPALVGFSLPWVASHYIGVVAWAMIPFIGLPLLVYSFYLPLLIIDRGLGFREALKMNHQIVTSLGMSLFACMLGLLLINVLALPLVIAPLVTLPVTFLALMILYDRCFNEY